MHYWLQLAMNDVRGLGFQVVDSSGEYATRYSFFDVMEKYNPDVVIADGHGDPSTLTGQSLKEVLKACYDNQVLSGKVVCTVSCLTGQKLGPDSRDKQAKAYTGFVNEFTWEIDPQAYPPSDQIAYPFQQIVRCMVKTTCQYYLTRISLKQAYQKIIDEFTNWISYYSTPPGSTVCDSTGVPRATDLLLSLRHDKSGIITIGKEAYVIARPIPLMPIASISVGALALAQLFL